MEEGGSKNLQKGEGWGGKGREEKEGGRMGGNRKEEREVQEERNFLLSETHSGEKNFIR